MNELWKSIQEWFAAIDTDTLLRAGLVILVSLVVAWVVSSALGRTLARQSPQRAKLLQRIAFYAIATLGVLGALREVGFDLSVLLGAAGILTVAIGFASQTSASNLISGLFLIGENAFNEGDTIRVGTVSGEVLSIDMLSIKLRTFDNLYVRVPNETLIKSELTNLSRFPLRRIDLLIRVGYGENLERVRELLFELAAEEPRILEEPKPIFVAQDFEADGVLLQFSSWVRREIFLEVRSSLQIAVRRRFDERGIAVPGSRWILDRGEVAEAS